MKQKKILPLLLSAALAVSALVTGVSAEEPAAGQAMTEENVTAIHFSDIAEDAAYKDAVYKLVNNGVLDGYPDGTFRPEGNLTRAEMCKMINLTFGYTDTEGAAGFVDLDLNEWYMPYVLAAQKAGYVVGDETGLFRPNDNISREEVCTILYRLIQPYNLGLPVTIADPVSDWAREYVETIVQNSLMPLEEGNTFR
ncbi:MAG: S-layer homology domain-containing protein, partial [Eubacteriales bacterium]